MTTMPRAVAACMSMLSTPIPARPMTCESVGGGDHLFVSLGGGADGEGVVGADEGEEFGLGEARRERGRRCRGGGRCRGLWGSGRRRWSCRGRPALVARARVAQSSQGGDARGRFVRPWRRTRARARRPPCVLFCWCGATVEQNQPRASHALARLGLRNHPRPLEQRRLAHTRPQHPRCHPMTSQLPTATTPRVLIADDLSPKALDIFRHHGTTPTFASASPNPNSSPSSAPTTPSPSAPPPRLTKR